MSGTPEPHRDFLLSALRVASLRAKTYEVEINTIGIALKDGMISVTEALKWIKDIGAEGLIGMIPDEISDPNLRQKSDK